MKSFPLSRFASTQCDWNLLAPSYADSLLVNDFILYPNLKQFILRSNAKSFLDIGCGVGRYASYALSCGIEKVVGVEPSAKMLQLATQRYPGPRYIKTNAEEMELNQSFDLILANMVVCNLSTQKQLEQFFNKARKHSRPGSKLLVTNIHPHFQRTCDFGWQGLDYGHSPAANGSIFKVKLKSRAGGFLYFENHHWEKNKIVQSGLENGWRLDCSVPLYSSNSAELKPHLAKYMLYIFS